MNVLWLAPIYGGPFLDMGKYTVFLNRLSMTVLPEWGEKATDGWLTSITCRLRLNQLGGKHMVSAPTGALLSECLSSRRVLLVALPSWEGGRTFPAGLEHPHGRQQSAGWFLHVLKVKERVETGFICNSKHSQSHKLFISPHFSSIQPIPYHHPFLLLLNHYFTRMKYLNNSLTCCPKADYQSPQRLKRTFN